MIPFQTQNVEAIAARYCEPGQTTRGILSSSYVSSFELRGAFRRLLISTRGETSSAIRVVQRPRRSSSSACCTFGAASAFVRFSTAMDGRSCGEFNVFVRRATHRRRAAPRRRIRGGGSTCRWFPHGVAVERCPPVTIGAENCSRLAHDARVDTVHNVFTHANGCTHVARRGVAATPVVESMHWLCKWDGTALVEIAVSDPARLRSGARNSRRR